MKYKKSPLFTQNLIYTVLVALSINASANTDMPDYYTVPGLDMDRDFINEHANEYIDLFMGKLQLHHAGLVIPLNAGMDIKMQPMLQP
jgi:hypothetical protein